MLAYKDLQIAGLIICLTSVAAPFGCKRSSVAGNGVTFHPQENIKISPLVQLPANRTVHCIVTSQDALIYCSETDDGQDVAVALPPSGIPRATALSSANILAALGESNGGSGAIQSLQITRDDVVWFYFLGGKGRRLHACLGEFSVADETIRILADTPLLQTVSGMGDALGLARGTLLATTPLPRLLLRHTDGWTILEPRPGEAQPIRKWLDVATEDGQPFPLNQDRYEPAAGADDAVLLLDRPGNALLSMDRAGDVKVLFSLVGLPKELSLPRLRDKSVLIFAADSELIDGDAFDTMHRTLPTASYPALLTLSGGKLSALSRDDLRTSGGLSNFSLRLHELVPTAGRDYVAYDSASGQIVKLAWVDK